MPRPSPSAWEMAAPPIAVAASSDVKNSAVARNVGATSVGRPLRIVLVAVRAAARTGKRRFASRPAVAPVAAQVPTLSRVLSWASGGRGVLRGLAPLALFMGRGMV